MQALRAVVKNGRLVLDEPTKLPEGTIERGDHMDAFEFVARLRAKREAAHR